MGRLGVRQREAVVLRHVAGLTEPEIAQAMGVTRGTVNATLRAAHERLRSALVEDVPDRIPSVGANDSSDETIDAAKGAER